MLTTDIICHHLKDDYTEGFEDQGGPFDLNTFLRDMVAGNPEVKFHSKPEFCHCGFVTIDMRYAYWL